MDKLNNIGLYFETAIADQPVITKKRVVECLQQIGQRELAGIIKNQGMYHAVVYTAYVYETWSSLASCRILHNDALLLLCNYLASNL